MFLRRVLSFADPLACEAAIGTADVELFPTTKGNFHAKITQIGMNGLLMHRVHISLPEISTVAVKRGRRSIGFLTEPDSAPLLHCGLEVLPGDIVLNRSDVVHQRSEANFRYGTLSLPLDGLVIAAKAIIGRELPKMSQKPVIRPPAALMHRLLSLHRSVGQLAHDTPDILEQPGVRRALEQQLIHAMVRCLAEGAGAEMTKGAWRHDVIMRLFGEFLAANRDRPLYLTEICAGIAVAERTLRASCKEHLGMGPIRYLTLRRLHLVRRALLKADVRDTTVTRLVTDHGFWELGRFSVVYRQLFGECPSETLRRPQQQTAIYLNRTSPLDTNAWSFH
ncbi:helix-turn-helix domain-containing protein [Bradyrhizobium sp. Pha-3]|uniref:helix-turn-helix domain-containing protein n=1 Tax=Bradyrhizobium sp. Pha-3 TaxID=208375 RepID=UPI0035D48060